MEMIQSFTATDTFVLHVLRTIMMTKPAVHAFRKGKKPTPCIIKNDRSPDEKTGGTFYA